MILRRHHARKESVPMLHGSSCGRVRPARIATGIMLLGLCVALGCGEEPPTASISPSDSAHGANSPQPAEGAKSATPDTLGAAASKVTPHPGETAGLQLRNQRIELPAEFPDDVPVYPGSAPSTVNRTDKRLVVIFGSDDSTDEVSGYFQDQLQAKGWTLQTGQQTPLGSLVKAGKPGRGVSVVISRVDKGKSSEMTLIALAIGN